MTKLFFKKIEKCSDCPNSYRSKESIKLDVCLITDKRIFTETPDWCPLPNFEMKIEANETQRVWVKIK